MPWISCIGLRVLRKSCCIINQWYKWTVQIRKRVYVKKSYKNIKYSKKENNLLDLIIIIPIHPSAGSHWSSLQWHFDKHWFPYHGYGQTISQRDPILPATHPWNKKITNIPWDYYVSFNVTCKFPFTNLRSIFFLDSPINFKFVRRVECWTFRL